MTNPNKTTKARRIHRQAFAEESQASDEFYTPAWVFEALDITFDLDVCAPPGGVGWIPAARSYSKDDNALEQPWVGRVWMNPPFSFAAPWVARFISHHHGIALLPLSKSQWALEAWTHADGIAFPGKSLSEFTQGPIFMPCFLVAMGEECVEAVARVGKLRR
jgi:hypothetical protein